MAAIVKSWMRAWCGTCDARRIFELNKGWTLRCSDCGHERHLAKNGLLAAAS